MPRPTVRSGVRTLAAAALAALAGCGGGDGASGNRAAQPSLPQTPFEQARGARWTSLAEERRFLAELDRRSARIRVAATAPSVEGRPIRLVVVGPATRRARVAAESTALFVCTQHGDEPAGREACLQRIRDHAASGDPRTLLVIPTANPDGVAADTRENAQGRDVNRDHLTLRTPEARFVARVMRDYAPDVLGDMHEYSRPGAREVLFHEPGRGHPAADPAVRDLSARAVVERLHPALRRAGFTTGTYEVDDEPDPQVLLLMAGLRHTVGALVETPRAGSLSPARRVAAQRAAFDALAGLLRERRDELAAVTSRSRRTAVTAVAAQRAATGVPCAYDLDDDADPAVQEILALQGLRATGAGASRRVALAQPAGAVAALLLGPEGPLRQAVARPVPC